MGQLLNTIQCQSCGYESYTADTFMDMPVSVEKTVEKGFKDFFKSDEIEGWF
jgi:ubiquitin C-terminal hydrolase